MTNPPPFYSLCAVDAKYLNWVPNDAYLCRPVVDILSVGAFSFLFYYVPFSADVYRVFSVSYSFVTDGVMNHPLTKNDLNRPLLYLAYSYRERNRPLLIPHLLFHVDASSFCFYLPCVADVYHYDVCVFFGICLQMDHQTKIDLNHLFSYLALVAINCNLYAAIKLREIRARRERRERLPVLLQR